jgi:DNA polymerase
MNPIARDYFRQQRELGFHTIYLSEDPAVSNTGSRADELNHLFQKTRTCTKCGLSASRKNYVFGQGSPEARLMFVGEAPGADEDEQGLPFVGRAGSILTKMIENGMRLSRDSVYIANILKCRPPNNRDPKPGERNSCTPILVEQIKIIRPEFICCLGRIAGRFLLGLDDTTSLRDMRSKFYPFLGAKVCVTYHPSALLQHPEWKSNAWADLKFLMQAMELAIPDHFK